jgi:CDP-diacylglycerol--glycerol-3-phosphate 3-phosphatidyltransferase
MTLPNKLTLVRIGLAMVFIALLSFEHIVCLAAGLVIFIVAAITDYYDGKIAREQNLITNFGKLVDPVADKILVAAAFIMMMKLESLWIPGWVVVVVLAREFLVTAARGLAATEGAVLAANRWGKYKTVFQMTFIIAFLVFAIAARAVLSAGMPGAQAVVAWLAPVSMVAAVLVGAFTVFSGVQFVWTNWKTLRLDNL